MAYKYSALTPQLSDNQILLCVFAEALASHAYFKIWEPTALSALRLAVIATVIFFAALYNFTPRGFLHIGLLYIETLAVYFPTLFTSIALYRLVYHPLRHIPGDQNWALWKWAAQKSAKRGQLGYDTKKLHDKYGPVIRLGPNWVDFQNPAVINKIYGATPTQLRKGSWYDYGMGKGFDALQHCKDDTMHAKRRKVWDQGFSIKALSEYEGDITHRINELVTGVAKASNSNPDHIVDMELWSSFFSFDVMGDLGFGEGFKMLENGVRHRFIDLVQGTMRVSPHLSQVSWIKPLLRELPPPPEQKEFQAFSRGQVQKRILAGSKRRDLYTHLLGEEGEQGFRMSQMQLNSDAVLIIIAGSDTTSSVLTWAWYYLCKTRDRHYYKLLQQELDKAAEDGELDPTSLSKLPLLNAVINETMRLQPPVPGGLQRYAPKGGIVLDGVYVPGGTTVSVGAYTIQRDPANWSPAPNEFRPERWIDSDKEIAANKAAFIPFSFGPRSCPGKGLAMMECRLVLANLMTRYDAKLKPDFNCEAFEAGVRDYFTIQSLSLPLLMIPRSSKTSA